MQKIRKILFYLFTAVYAVLCPFLLMYARGYIMKPGEDEQLVRTGGLYVSTAPPGGEIYVGGKFSGKKTPDFIQGIIPGEYEVKLLLDGYREWEVEIEVAAGKTTVIDTVLFDPKKRDVERILPGQFKKMLGIRGTDKIFLFKGEQLSEIELFDHSNGENADTVFSSDVNGKKRTGKIFTVNESPYVLVFSGPEKEGEYFWVDITGQEARTTDVTRFFEKFPDKIKWEAGGGNNIFIMENGRISMIDVKVGAVYPAILEDARGYGIYEGRIYVLSENNEFFVTDRTGKNRRDIMTDPEVVMHAFPEEGYVDIEMLDKDIFAFRGMSGELFFNKLPYRFVDKGVSGLEFDVETSRLLFWIKDRIGIIDFSHEDTGQVEFEKGPSITWVYKGRDIKDAFWVYQASHVIFSDGGDLKLLEIIEGGKFLVSNVADGSYIEDFVYFEKDGTVYFLDKQDGGFYSTVIVPAKSFIPKIPSIPGAEDTGSNGGEG
jgi:hypothetical protein